VITMLVVNALDDLDASRTDVETALRLVATLAWQEGYESGAGHP
jgi:hypothetical protein